MKKKVLATLLAISVLFTLGATALAATRDEQLQVYFRNISIKRDGEPIVLKDGKGTELEPFLYNESTYAPIRAVAEALGDETWPVPVVWNCGGYESVETLRLLEGKIQVYLPDLKYALPEPAKRYSGAEDYFERASAAILEMYRQTGPYVLEDGRLRRGVVIRHLQLPGELENTRRCIDWVAETFRPGEVLFSLMSQYTPQPGAKGPLARHVTGAEYRAAVAYMENCGITDGYTQERTSAKEEYTPDFDLRGV